MNAERPTFEVKRTITESVTLPQEFVDALQREQPDGLKWDRMDGAIAVLKGEKDAIIPKPPDPEPTKSQKIMRDLYRTGDLSPYQKGRPGINLQVVKEAWENPQSQGENSAIMAVDLAIRGGADKKYNQLGPVSHRLKRQGMMVVNMAPAMALDVVTSVPSNILVRVGERYIDKEIKDKNPQSSIVRKLVAIKSGEKGLQRMFEIMNDKNLTSLTNIWVKQLTGEKGDWIDEANDKLGDLLDAAANDVVEDFVNGSVTESAMRIVYEIPVVGALWEQTWTRLSLFMRSSQFVKGNMKGVFMGLGFVLGTLRNANGQERKSPSIWLADKIWSPLSSHMDHNENNFFDFIDTGKKPTWNKE